MSVDAGKVRRVNRDGTYDIDYDDGEKELGVPVDFVRSLEPPSKRASPQRADSLDDTPAKSSGAAAPREGDRVEARYKGRARFYPGDDNERYLAFHVLHKYFSVFPSQAQKCSAQCIDSRGATAALREGDRVEARCKGRGALLPR